MKLLFSLSLLVLSGCGIFKPDSPPSTGTHEETPRSGGGIELSPTSSGVVYPDGWTGLLITANSAKTTITLGSHFATTRNSCGKDAYGAVPLDVWNPFVTELNKAASAEFSQQDYCIPIPDTYPFLDGSAELKIENKSRQIFQYVGGEICTKIADHTAAERLLGLIQKIIVIADKEDCPNGWGSP